MCVRWCGALGVERELVSFDELRSYGFGSVLKLWNILGCYWP